MLTHGVCDECAPKVDTFTEMDFTNAELLRDIQGKLSDAGRRNDLNAAESIIEGAVKANIRAIDIMVGIIVPLLYQVGEDWKRGALTVAGEHRFTAFCEKVFELIIAKVKLVTPARPIRDDRTDALLMNAPGNRHLLAIRILELQLSSRGMEVRAVAPPLGLDDLLALIRSTRPSLLLLSIALVEQCKGITAIVGRIAELPMSIRPRVIVGGYAVKLGLISTLRGAELMADISSL